MAHTAQISPEEFAALDKAGLIWRCPKCTQAYRVAKSGMSTRCIVCEPYSAEELAEQIRAQGMQYAQPRQLAAPDGMPAAGAGAGAGASIESLYLVKSDPLPGQDLSTAIKFFRVSRDYTQEAFAKVLDVKSATVYRAESGRTTPTPRLLLRMAKLALDWNMELYARKFAYHATVAATSGGAL